MKGIEWQYFVDDAYLGIDAFLIYRGYMYQYAGARDRKLNKRYAYVAKWKLGEERLEIIWEVYTDTLEERWQAFMAAKIFEGKTLEEAGDEVEFYDWG